MNQSLPTGCIARPASQMQPIGINPRLCRFKLQGATPLLYSACAKGGSLVLVGFTNAGSIVLRGIK